MNDEYFDAHALRGRSHYRSETEKTLDRARQLAAEDDEARRRVRAYDRAQEVLDGYAFESVMDKVAAEIAVAKFFLGES